MWDTWRGTSLSALLRQLKTGANAPLLDDMVKPIHRLVLLQTLRTTPLPSSERTSKFLGERLVLPKSSEDGLVGEVRDVFRIVEICGSRGAFVRLLAATRFAREYT